MTREEKIEKIKTKFASQLVDRKLLKTDFTTMLDLMPKGELDYLLEVDKPRLEAVISGFGMGIVLGFYKSGVITKDVIDSIIDKH